MTFEQILPALKQGKRVRRKLWEKENYIYAVQDIWCLFDEKGYALSTMNPTGIFADDWEVCGEENQTDKSGVSVVCKVTSNFDEYEQALDKVRCRLKDLREAAEKLNGIKLDIKIDFD
jgi:hypothetical protein